MGRVLSGSVLLVLSACLLHAGLGGTLLRVEVPEGTVAELPLFAGGIGLWLWWRSRSKR